MFRIHLKAVKNYEKLLFLYTQSSPRHLLHIIFSHTFFATHEHTILIFSTTITPCYSPNNCLCFENIPNKPNHCARNPSRVEQYGNLCSSTVNGRARRKSYRPGDVVIAAMMMGWIRCSRKSESGGYHSEGFDEKKKQWN